MTLAVSGLACRSHLAPTPHRLSLLCLRKVRCFSKSAAAVEPVADSPSLGERDRKNDAPVTVSKDRKEKQPEWKKLSSKELGIKMSSIPKPTRLILSGLRQKGYEVYLVGGCVRDLILKRTPKDFDIITSAELKEVKKTFLRCEIVGKRFPICHVHVNDATVEVSSFSTCERHSSKKFDSLRRPPGCNRHDYIRWRNCLQRDFTINGLMFDPFDKIVYDYMGGIRDIRKSKMRTVIPANISFAEDCGKDPHGNELYASIWVFGGIVEVIMEIWAPRVPSTRPGFRRRDESSNMLLSLFSNLDKYVAPNQPCHSSLWIAILAFHKALYDKPRDPLVIAAFSLAVSNGGSLPEAVEIVRTMSQPHVMTFHEILEPVTTTRSKNALINEVVDLAASVKAMLRKMTDPDYVSQAMMKFRKAPCSDLVFIPLTLSLRVCKIFESIKRELGRESVPKIGQRIDYDSLALGCLPEVQQMFATVVFDTVYPPTRKH
ncbi:putative poly(A) polymerase [Morus notabilis]|uniref:Putative poly(A) polymerase n=1 Tax=Morus notabilis TaxID=981085 RepID=W9RBW1_9ROSA|nr:putative poly(A) polymerase [Morus notabilis]